MKSYRYLFILLAVLMIQSCESALETDLEGDTVTLLAPVDSLVTTDSIHTFYWETLKGADEYRLQIVSPRFDSIVRFIEDSTIADDHFRIVDMDTGSYQWRVRGVNTATESNNSEAWNLKIY